MNRDDKVAAAIVVGVFGLLAIGVYFLLTAPSPNYNLQSGGATSAFQVLKTNVTVSYDAECLVLENIGHTCPTVSEGANGTNASPMKNVELVTFRGSDYYAGNFSAGFAGPPVSHNVWFTNSTIFCVSPLIGTYAACPVNESLPLVTW